MPTKPTKKAAKKAVKKAVVKQAVKKAPAEKAAPKKVVAKKAATKKTAVKKTAAKKAVKKKQPIVTKIIAKVDAGFGNQLCIRGGGSGLSWDAGVLMENVGADEWVWSSTKVSGELEFKVLINDYSWSSGPNGVVFPGATVVFEPTF